MTLIAGDKVVTIQTASGPVLVQAGTPLVGDKGVTVQTSTGPVFLPVKTLIAGDKVVSLQTATGRVLVPVISGKTEVELTTDTPGWTYWSDDSCAVGAYGPNIAAVHSGAPGWRTWLQCRDACPGGWAICWITSPTFTGKWRRITVWRKVPYHYVFDTSQDNYFSCNLVVNGTTVTNFHKSIYMEAQNNYSEDDGTEPWVKVELRRSQVTCLDTDSCQLRFDTSLWKPNIQQTSTMTTYFDDVVIEY